MRRSRNSYVTSAMLVLPCLLIASAIGCSDPTVGPTESAPVCLEAGVDESCTPAYESTYDALYTNTFQRSCAASGVSCHASTGKQGGIDFGDPESGYEGLKAKLRAGEPECSILVHRIVATDGKVRMPPGRSLTAGEQCAIIKWVADGAHR